MGEILFASHLNIRSTVVMSLSRDILYIEDSAETALIVSATLNPHRVVTVSTLQEAEKRLQNQLFDLIILDLNLPDGDGLRFLAEKFSDQAMNLKTTPLIVLTSQKEVSHKVMAFAMGVDDYVCKPFQPEELRARVESRLRKTAPLPVTEDIVSLGHLTLNLTKQQAFVSARGSIKDLRLTRLEFKLLTKFLKSPDRVFSREYLIENVWGDATNVTDRTVDTHVAHLRKKLIHAGVRIETITGEGYRLTSDLPKSPSPDANLA
jgi:DNA-binding response OmpR family regulator